MKIKYFLPSLLLLGTFVLSGCDDFFDPETDDSLDGDKYMSSLTEMSTGYLGVLTRMQAVGDKAIYLTDTRGDLLEPTEQSINELIALYNYDEDLTGNSYADPAAYYDLVIACNDYIAKLLDFKKEYPEVVAETKYFEGLIASALRVKVWTYITIAEIYGQALWFDDPILKVEDLTDTQKFRMLSLEQTIDACIDLLHNGYEGYQAQVTFSWIEWLDPSNITSIANSAYRYWDTMTPPFIGLLSKCYLWKGAFMDSRGEDSSAYYEAVAANMLSELDYSFTGNIRYWSRTSYTTSHFSSFWDYSSPYGEECISAIIYDYTKSQTNQLLKHFSDEYPNQYLLRPAEVSRDRWTNEAFNPGSSATGDRRGNVSVKQNGVNYYIAKYRPVGSTARVNPYQDDCHIYTFRGGDYLFMLYEALNHTGRFVAADGILNNGVNNNANSIVEVVTNDSCDAALRHEWEGFTQNWTANLANGSANKYPYNGIRGCFALGACTLQSDTTTQETLAASMKYNDCILANEYMLEFAAEGKVYPALIRNAIRWNDPTIITSRVTPKYGDRAGEIESKIVSNNPITGLPGYFVPWDLMVE